MLYDAFAYVLIVEGLVSAAYLFTRAWRNKGDCAQTANMVIAGVGSLYISAVYCFIGIGVLTATLTIGVYIRPALMLLVAMPALIVYRGRL